MRTEDGHIINKCLNGDSAAFGLLVDKYKASIYALAYSKLRNFHDAEDVTQEVFINAYQKLRTLRRWDNFLAWLYAITSNLCKLLMRSQSRRPDREFIEDKSPETLNNASIDSHREKLAHESLYEALDSLPEMYRQVLMLYYLGGMSGKEIARFLGTSPATVRQRLSRARSQLKGEMLAMMSVTFEEQKLQATFTFRIVEAVKRMRIQPMPRMTGLPWGLSFATGIIIALISLNPHLRMLNQASSPMGTPLAVEAKILEMGEIPVDILRISHIPVVSSKQGDDDGGGLELPDPQNAAFIVTHGEGDIWAQRTDMPTARFYCAASVVNERIYVIGGAKKYGGNILPIPVEVYDPATDTWERKADSPTTRVGLSCAIVDGKIYAFGGASETDSRAVEVYDPVTDTWTTKSNSPPLGLWFSTSVVDGKIYAFGGSICHAVEQYDPATDTWTRKADKPLPGWEGMSSGVANGKIYVFGGEINADEVVSAVFEYDPVTDNWTQKADMPAPRAGTSAAVINGRIYVIGGHGPITPLTMSPGLPTVEIYDPATDTWEKKSDMPTPRTIVSTGVVNGQIYVIGGGATNFAQVLSTVEVYTPEGVVTAVSPQSKRTTPWGKIKSDRSM